MAVVEAVKRKLAEIQTSGRVPADLTILPTLDESRFIQNSIANVTSSGLLGALLAAVAVLFFLGSLRQTLIIVLAIPLATLMAILLMGLFDLSLNVFSLGGLALGVGIVVDNSIVMLEAIVNRVQDSDLPDSARNGARGEWVIRQSEQASQELESALLASTTTNIVAVVPFCWWVAFSHCCLTSSFSPSALPSPRRCWWL